MLFQKIKRFFGYKTIQEYRNSIEPCPLCGHKAELISIKDLETGIEWWHVECGDFVDHGAWTTTNGCNFMGIGYCGWIHNHVEVPHHITVRGAVKYWNDTVVPITLEFKNVYERMKSNSNKMVVM